MERADPLEATYDEAEDQYTTSFTFEPEQNAYYETPSGEVYQGTTYRLGLFADPAFAEVGSRSLQGTLDITETVPGADTP